MCLHQKKKKIDAIHPWSGWTTFGDIAYDTFPIRSHRLNERACVYLRDIAAYATHIRVDYGFLMGQYQIFDIKKITVTD